MIPAIQEMVISTDSTLRDAMRLLDSNGQGLCFVVRAGGVLVGSLSDGDIRRHLLAGGSIEDRVTAAAQRSPTMLRVGASIAETQAALNERVRLVPIVDETGRLVDYASARRYHQVPVLEPVLNGNELEYVTECIRTGWISSKGAFVSRLERTLAEFVGLPHAVAVSNGTVALHLALETLDIGPGDEVIVPDFTFAASINAIVHAGATPVLVDISRDTWTICPHDLEGAITSSTRAIMPVHIYGHACHMDEIMKIARARNLLVVEDCAESLGSLYRGTRVGTHGDAAAFSFFGNKVITTGEGGMVLFRDAAACEKARVLRDHGMDPGRRYWHDYPGYNYRMTNLQAAIGVAQMEQIDGFLERRRAIARRYTKLLARLPCISPQPLQSWAETNNWLYTILLRPDCPISRDALIDKLIRNGVETRPTFTALHLMPPYRDYARGRDFPVSSQLSSDGLSLPSAVSLTDADVDHVVECIAQAVRFAELKRTSDLARTS